MTQSTAPTAVQKTRYKPERRVLVVDDDEDFADSLAEFLETCGYSVCLAHDPHSAEEAIRQSQPQVAILDIRLSQTSGIELLSRISDSHPDITCLMMTADPGTNLPIESLRRGAYDYLRKPVKHEDLLGSLTRCFNKIFLEQKKAMVEQALQLSEERYRALYDNNPMMFLTVDEQGTVCSVNEYGAAQLGHRVDDLIGSPLAEVFYQEDRETLSDCLRACFEEPDKVHHWELRQVRGDGSILWSRETVRVVNQKTSEATALIVCEDITETRRLSEQLSYHASHDALTRLVNRREFEYRLQRVLETAHEEGSEHALCYLDLDQFKVINDTCGHVAGDELLRQISALLQGEVRKRDTLARLGGDEFGILMEHCSLEQATRVAATLRHHIEEYRFAWEERSFGIGASIGLVPITMHSVNSIEVLKQADAACYAAKDAGRNRIHVYQEDDTMLARRHGEMQWVAQINRALEEERFCLYAQPIVPLGRHGEGEAEHYELLLRMHGEEEQLIPPGAFLAAAERYNLSTRLDRWVVGHALNWLAGGPAGPDRVPRCTINLSGLSLGDSEFLEYVVRRFEETGVSPARICFEVTETAAIANLSGATGFVKALKGLGCRFALDDFGSGLSSFAYLKSLPVDYLKIDGVFVKDIETDPIDLAMVKSINDIGKVMGKQTIAEFVESEAILARLEEIGIDYAQGYYIGRPEPIEKMLLLVAAS